ncbi:MAG: DUF4338 domain-containing protein [Anaerolineales bacterium]|jgi:hypothetical protein
MSTARKQQRFCGREFTAQEVSLIQEVVANCAGLSRTELAHTICELLNWKRATGRLKAREGQQLLERLESQGLLVLPAKRSLDTMQSKKSISPMAQGAVHSELAGSVEQFTPIDVELVQSRQQRRLFRELVGRYHYLGYAMPYGARLQYLCYVSRPSRQVVGCMQFSSPAWRIKPRDQWIGWSDAIRGRRLQHVVNNSRFLVLAEIRNLASMLLGCGLRRLRRDWHSHYGVEPYLVETLVDRQRFHGGCYRAANFIVVGETSGRGRMDRSHQRHGAQVKTVMVYPLVKDAARRLTEAG